MAFASFHPAGAPPTGETRRRESLTGSVRRGGQALRDLVRVRRARVRLRVERLLVVGGGAAALVVAAGATLAAAVVLVVVGATLGLTGALGLPSWAWLTISGALLGALVLVGARVMTRRLRLDDWPEHGGHRADDGDERALAAEERIARAGLAQSTHDAVDALTSPATLLAAFGVGFLGTRVLRRHPWLLRTLLGIAGFGLRRRAR